MQYLDALEGLRSQGYPNEEVTDRRYEIMQRFIEGVRNFELKRNLALMYAPEQYVEAPPTVEALRFTVQQYLRMRGSARSNNYPMIPLHNNRPTSHNLISLRQRPCRPKKCSSSPPPTCGTPATTCATGSLPTATPTGVLQLRRSVALRGGLPAEGPRTEAGATASELLSHKPVPQLDVPLSATWLEL